MNTSDRFDLICFDVDGTLVKHPTGMVIWEVLNLKYGGTSEINRHRYEQYRRGKISYEEWVRLDVEGWQAAGATREEINESVAEFRLIDGAREAVAALKDRGFKLAVISGTLDIVLERLFPDHPFDEVFTNKLLFDDDGSISGWVATRFDGQGKPDALKEIAKRHHIALERSAFVGDGENDVPLLGVAGFFVAYQPKSSELESRADVVITDDNLHRLADIF